MADWVNIGGSLAATSAGSRTTVWGVNSGNGIYRYTGDQGTTDWVGINGSLVRIDAGSRTNVGGASMSFVKAPLSGLG
ncbi:tectonin domain-containing protein [Streptomyces sp. NPDC006655]|uniref:tectonin domain-containing protein n=1 Tax=Streptomyces sp. NPDC006655 TaxID=3156898 RepID=UPI003456D298